MITDENLCVVSSVILFYEIECLSPCSFLYPWDVLYSPAGSRKQTRLVIVYLVWSKSELYNKTTIGGKVVREKYVVKL